MGAKCKMSRDVGMAAKEGRQEGKEGVKEGGKKSGKWEIAEH
jgi:hypothetical protein